MKKVWIVARASLLENSRKQVFHVLLLLILTVIASSTLLSILTEGVRLKLIKALFDSNSRYAVIVITSLFGMLDRINRPGTAHFENWTFRLPWSLREILTDPKGSDVVRKLATAIRLSGRAK